MGFGKILGRTQAPRAAAELRHAVYRVKRPACLQIRSAILLLLQQQSSNAGSGPAASFVCAYLLYVYGVSSVPTPVLYICTVLLACIAGVEMTAAVCFGMNCCSSKGAPGCNGLHWLSRERERSDETGIGGALHV